MKRPRLFASLAIAGVAIAAVCYIPLPHHIDCAFEVRPSKAGAVYAGSNGQLVYTVEPGIEVQEGDTIAQLRNPDLEIQLAQLKGEEQVAEVQLRNISLRSRDDHKLKAQLETQTEYLTSLREVRQKTEEELERLTVKARRSGLVYPPAERKPQDSGDGRLPGWTGSPLEASNRGALMTADDLLCEIGAPGEFDAVLVIDQGDVQLVKTGQSVDLKLDSLRLQTFTGELTELSQSALTAASTSLSSQTGGDLQTEIDPQTGMIKPRSVSYQGRVPWTAKDLDLPLKPGYRGSAKIHVAPMSLGTRLWRIITQTFNFEF